MKTRTEILERLKGLEARQSGLSINTIIQRGAIARTLRWVLETEEDEKEPKESEISSGIGTIPPSL